MQFRAVFVCTVMLTLLSMGASIFLALAAPTSASVVPLIETFATTWKMGFGAVLGLLGGRLTRSDSKPSEHDL